MKKKYVIFSKDVIFVMLATFFYQFSIQAVNPLINGYARNLGMSTALAGIIVGALSITSMLLRPFAGNLSDHVSKYHIAVLGGTLCLVSNLGYLFAYNYFWLLSFRIINGVGFVLCTVCLATWMAFLVPRDHVGAAMGYYGMLNAISMAIAPALAISLYQRFGYDFILIISAISAGAMVITVQFISNRGVPVFVVDKKIQFKFIQQKALPVAVIIALMSIPYFATQAGIVMYVEEKHVNVTVSLFFLVYAVILFTVRLFLKNYFDTISFGTWFYICSVATIGYILLLTVMTNNIEMVLAAGMMSIGFGIMVSICQSTALLLAPIEEQGIANSTYFLGVDVGMSIGPIVGGVIPTIFPISFLYPLMLILIPMSLVIYLYNRRSLDNAINSR